MSQWRTITEVGKAFKVMVQLALLYCVISSRQNVLASYRLSRIALPEPAGNFPNNYNLEVF